MVARNLDRGKGLLRPQLDTAPFPNYFLVEPPIYESGVVVLKRATGLSLEEAGRILSALATALAALGLFRAGTPARRPARGLPGRGGLRGFSAHGPLWARLPARRRHDGGRRAGPGLLGSASLPARAGTGSRPPGSWSRSGFALKITAAFLLVPLLLVIARARSPRAMLTVCSTLLPALLWYAWADHLLGSGEGSRASADNRSIWLGLLGPSALLKPETLKFVGWFLLVRAFTPLGGGPGGLVGAFGDRGELEPTAIATALSGWSGESRHWSPWRFSRRNCITSITGC